MVGGGGGPTVQDPQTTCNPSTCPHNSLIINPMPSHRFRGQGTAEASVPVVAENACVTLQEDTPWAQLP